MKSLVTALSLILLLQCALITVVYLAPGQNTENDTAAGLLPFDPDKVDEIHIGDSHGNETVLLRLAAGWVLPETSALPVDANKVDTLLHGLLPQNPGWPVANSPAARQRMQVADYHYQRRIILIGGGELLGTHYLGTAPGFRKVHARSDGQEDIYSIELNSFDVPALSEMWVDRTLLQLRIPISISSELYDIRRKGEGWISGWGNTPDSRELSALLDSLDRLQIEGIADQDTQRELATATPELTLELNSLQGERRLELFSMEGQYFVHSSDHQLFFRLAGSDYRRLISIDADKLMAGSPKISDPL